MSGKNRLRGPRGKCIVITGNFGDGFRFFGPFVDFDAAALECDFVPNSWVATLEEPEKVKEV